jgi:hypothetical protein
MGEIANVVAGQAKALLASTPYEFTFSLPRVAVGASSEFDPGLGFNCRNVIAGSELGKFALQLSLTLVPQKSAGQSGC